MIKLLFIDIFIYAASIVMFVLAIFGVLPVIYPVVVFCSGFVFEMFLLGYEIKHAQDCNSPVESKSTSKEKDAS